MDKGIKRNHVVLFSGGACSWAAAKRVAKKHDNVTLLFADTCMEDEDLYRFLPEAVENVGGTLVRIADGRTPWEIMRDEGVIGRAGADPCSRVLKRELMKRWQNENCDPNGTTLYLGLDWTEGHRLERVRKTSPGWNYQAPMLDAPYLSKKDMLNWMESEGLKPPRLYKMGFSHNNCGGFCIKAGQAQFERLYRTMPERYKWHENEEQKTRAVCGDYAFLRDRSGGKTKYITMAQFREGLEKQSDLFDSNDWGGCGCGV